MTGISAPPSGSPPQWSLAGCIFDWAKKVPDKIAVVHNGKSLSYLEFATAIAGARGYFARHGIEGAGTAILACSRLIDFWIMSLALRSLGLTTIAVPDAEQVGALDLPDLRVVVATPLEAGPGLTNACAARRVPCLVAVLEGEEALWPGSGSDQHTPGGHILQTSGTTGMFKMVLCDPSNENRVVAHRVEFFGWSHDSVAAAFNFSAWTGTGYRMSAGMWTLGATVVIQDELPLYRGLLYPGLTIGAVTPAMLDIILQAPEGAFPRQENLKLGVVGGMPSRAQVDGAKARITPQIYNVLGATEVGTFGYTLLDDPSSYRLHDVAPGAGVEVVDDDGRPVPVGQIGHVRVRVTIDASSYLRDPATTAIFFRDGYFYPGDLAIFQPDGRLLLQGRSIDVLNINGHKVIPDPIESRLRDRLGTSVCLSVVETSHDERLFLAIETSSEIDAERLQNALQPEMNDVIGAFRIAYLKPFPRNHMGKVIRREVARLLAGLPASNGE